MASTEVKYKMTSTEAKYNNDIDRGQVQQVHGQGTSIEVKFIKFIEKIDNDIGKKNSTTTSIKSKEFNDNIDKKNP